MITNKVPNICDYDAEMLTLCYKAAQESFDPSTKNGSIIVDARGNVVSAQCNQMPTGVELTDVEWLDKDLKYRWIVHAEAAAILSAAKNGIPIDGCTMYASWAACVGCAKTIVQSGIKCVITHSHNAQRQHAHWIASISVAKVLFSKCGVSFFIVDAYLDQEILFNGKLIKV